MRRVAVSVSSLLRRKPAGLLFLSFLVSALLRVPYFLHSFIFIDEAWWANGAKILVQGGRLYKDLLMDKNPPIFLFCAFLFSNFGLSPAVMHVGALCLVLTVSWLLYSIGCRFFTPAVGGVAAILYALASTMYYTPRIIGMTNEALMVVFTTSAIYCFLEGMLRARPYGFFLAGFFASLATITKPVAITESALLVLFLMLGPGDKFMRRLRSLVLWAAGYACGLLLLFAYLTGTETLVPWWEQCILYGFRYVSLITWPMFFYKFLRASAAFAIIYAWIWILIWRSKTRTETETAAYRLGVCWIASALIGVIIGRRFYANYFIQVMPPLALVGAIGAVHLWDKRQDPRSRVMTRAVGVAFLISFVWFHSQTFAHWYFAAFPEAHKKVEFWGICREDRQTADIAAHLKSNTKPRDRLFVWGSKAQLYFLADRELAGNYMDFDVSGDWPPNTSDVSVQRNTAQELHRKPPSYIIDVQQVARLEGFPAFRSLVEELYELETQIHGARLYRLRPTPNLKSETSDIRHQ